VEATAMVAAVAVERSIELEATVAVMVTKRPRRRSCYARDSTAVTT
jgi:hypothetical protein